MKNKLLEARKILKASDATELLNNGKLAGMIGGRKFIPQWVWDDPKHFENLVDATLTLIGSGQNVATDETIKYLMKCSMNDVSIWEKAITESPDTVVYLSTAFLSKWIQEGEWVTKLDNLAAEPKYNQIAWHDLEKDLQDKIEAVQQRRGKKFTTSDNTLFTTLYDDGTWKLCIPKSQKGDSELASHIQPFKYLGKTYTKTRWCTAASNNFYNNYSKDGNKYYVIQYYKNGVYTDAWQIAFDGATHVEFMDKYDSPEYRKMLEVAPKEMLQMITVDNPNSEMFGISMDVLVKGYTKIDPTWSSLDLSRFDEAPWYAFPQYYEFRDGIIIEKKSGTIMAVEKDKVKESITIPKYVKAVKSASLFYKTVIKEVTFEVGCEIVPAEMFVFNSTLELVVLPNTIKRIGESAFRKCSNLVDIALPPSLKTIGEEAFARTGLQSVQLPEGLEQVEDLAFRKCADLEVVTLPDSLQFVGDEVFEDCTELKTVNLSSVDNISWGEDVFMGCESLQTPEIVNKFEIE